MRHRLSHRVKNEPLGNLSAVVELFHELEGVGIVECYDPMLLSQPVECG